MNVLIVEDEMMAQANLARALTQQFPDVRSVGTTGSGRETVLWLRTPGNSADVIFMDVELSDGECFEIFRQADVTARVIMTTAYDNYALRAFEVNSIDYLRIPIDPAALRRAVERCRVRSGGIDPDVLLNAIRGPREYKQRYVVRFNDRIVPVQTTDIAYFYSEEKNTFFVLCFFFWGGGAPAGARAGAAAGVWISRSTSFLTNWIPGGFSAYRAVASSPCRRSSAS